jgi:hypothetical protein
VADTGASSEFAKRKLKVLRFTQDFQRGLDDYAA